MGGTGDAVFGWKGGKLKTSGMNLVAKQEQKQTSGEKKNRNEEKNEKGDVYMKQISQKLPVVLPTRDNEMNASRPAPTPKKTHAY